MLCRNTALTVVPIFIAWKVIDGKALWGSPDNLTFDTQTVLASLESKVAKFAPVLACESSRRKSMMRQCVVDPSHSATFTKLTPRVTNNPIHQARLFVRAPADNADNMVHHFLPEVFVLNNTAFVLDEGLSIDT